MATNLKDRIAIDEKIAAAPAVTLRPGKPEDSQALIEVSARTLADLAWRLGYSAELEEPDEATLAQLWRSRRSLLGHLARNAEHFWVAERSGQLIGYARSLCRNGLRELTEFFVLPGEQSAGVGRELLARTFPVDGVEHRCIIATADLRALARYLKTGVSARFPIYTFQRAPEPVQRASDLLFRPVVATSDTLDTLAELDQAILGHRRDADHTWLLNNRYGFLYVRNGAPVGYGYVGLEFQGPFALREDRDFPAVLAHAETLAHACGVTAFGLDVPLVNRTAVDYLLGRGYQMSPFSAQFMSNEPFGHFENYIITAPMYFI
jgi:hypothetical protein